MGSKNITFSRLKSDDLDLLCQWFNKPHVLEWWNDHLTAEEIKEKYGKRVGDSVVCPYIVYLNEKPIGYIQYYWANRLGSEQWSNEDDNAVGLDQFIGDENYLNQGLGTLMLKAFIKYLFENHPIKKIITEADLNNLRAKRCYQKAGFHEASIINTPDSKSILMEIKRN